VTLTTPAADLANPESCDSEESGEEALHPSLIEDEKVITELVIQCITPVDAGFSLIDAFPKVARGAGRYSQAHWDPSAGVGFDLTRNFGIDAALFGTQTFLEPRPHVGLAISLRFDKR
jgi:hypothetical protein